MEPIPDHARCLACNYSLRGLTNFRCPECGRDFIPQDAATMNLGRVPGFIARRLLRPSGWTVVILATAATIVLIATTGLPRIVPPRLADTLYLLDRKQWRGRSYSAQQTAYLSALVTWTLVIGFYTLRITLRRIAQAIYQPPQVLPHRRGMRRSLLTFALISIALVLFGWPLRVAHDWSHWVDDIQSSVPRLGARSDWIYRCPIAMSREDQLTALRMSIAHSFSRKQRTMSLGLLIEFQDLAPNDFVDIASKDNDPELRVLAIHILSLDRQPQNAPVFRTLLEDADSGVRAAAADGIDILRGSGVTRIDEQFIYGQTSQIDAHPPIKVDKLLYPATFNGTEWKSPPHPPIAVDPAARNIFERIMLSATNPDEREAAARALVHWPPPAYILRAAEWGVWISDAKGELELMQSLADELPPFVHRIGNPHASLADRYLIYSGPIKKPIVHFTTDRPLALDVEVHIREGRPWFAYPKPDDLALSHRGNPFGKMADGRNHSISADDIKALDNSTIPALDGLREGYPWLLPPHRMHFEEPGFGPPANPWATGLGLRWQSLIVLPTQASWMTPPTVPADAKFKWWSDIRAVPTSFVSSRGETERFLYYDGPTLAMPPLIASLNEQTLTLRPWFEKLFPARERTGNEIDGPTLTQETNAHTLQREGFFIRVTSGQATAMRFAIADSTKPIAQELPVTLPIASADAILAFKKLLTDYGLTAEESEGLIAAWKAQFFQTNGQRLLLRLSASDYDTLCPLSIRPPPTTLVRLGFVLTEF